MKCPFCGAAELIHDTRDVPTSYQGESTTVFSVTGDFCQACAEIVLNQVHGDRYSALVGQFQQQVNAAYVDPDFVARVRKKLELGQRDSADIFGGGVNAFFPLRKWQNQAAAGIGETAQSAGSASRSAG